jgi:hypothetical protein
MRSAPRCPAWISTSSADFGEDGFNNMDTAPGAGGATGIGLAAAKRFIEEGAYEQ